MFLHADHGWLKQSTNQQQRYYHHNRPLARGIRFAGDSRFIDQKEYFQGHSAPPLITPRIVYKVKGVGEAKPASHKNLILTPQNNDQTSVWSSYDTSTAWWRCP